MKKYFLLLITLFMMSFSWAQERQISGTITSFDDEPLIGVTVMIKGSTKGTTTNFEGKYSISTKEGETLVFSYIGFRQREVAVASQSTISISLEEDAAQLDEIVVVGYGTQKKSEITSAISTAEGDDLRKISTGDIATSLQGRVSGVQVSNSGTTPGGSPTVLIRGLSTVNNNSPLYVVDNAIVEDITFLSPKDIESVQVLKDASSASIYGARGSNGVIIINTIKGEQGKLTVSFDAQVGVQNLAKDPRAAGKDEYLRGLSAIRGEGFQPSEELLSGPNSNWVGEVSNPNALMQDYNISITGGTEKIRYNFSGNYFQQEGIFKGANFERFTGRLGLDIDLTDRLTLEQTVTFTPSTNDQGIGDALWTAQRSLPTDAIYKPIDQRQGLNEFSIFAEPSTRLTGNIAAQIARNFYQTKESKIFSNTALSYEAIDGLTFKTQLTYYSSLWEENSFSPEYTVGPNDFNNIISISRSHNVRKNYSWFNTINYSKAIGRHNFTVLLGSSVESYSDTRLWASGQNIPNNHPDLRQPSATVDGFNIDGNYDPYSLASFFGRFSYSYGDKYFLTANFRRDGSSNFSAENRWGNFPSLSAGWTISNENFLKDSEWLSLLKIRGGWGLIGNQDIPNGATMSTLRRADYAVSPDGNAQMAPGFEIGQIGNNDLVWETVRDANIGIDLGFLNDKFTLTFDYFDRYTSDMLLLRSVPAHLGYPEPDRYADRYDGSVWSNIGNISTNGWDATITYNLQKSDWSLGISANVSHVNTTVDKFANEGDFIQAGYDDRISGNYITRTEEGGVVGAFFGYDMLGIFQNQKEINSHSLNDGTLIQPTAKPGDVKYADLNGDGQITPEDRTYIGDPTPDLVYGLTLNATYKNWDFSATFQGTYGNDIVNGLGWYTYSGALGESNFLEGAVDRAWSGEGSTNDYPRLGSDGYINNFNNFSQQYIEDGSFVRLQNIQLGYTVNNFQGIDRLRIFVSGQNLFTLSNYKGPDVDLSGGSYGIFQRGIDWGVYPTPRTILGGINVSF